MLRGDTSSMCVHVGTHILRGASPQSCAAALRSCRLSKKPNLRQRVLGPAPMGVGKTAAPRRLGVVPRMMPQNPASCARHGRRCQPRVRLDADAEYICIYIMYIYIYIYIYIYVHIYALIEYINRCVCKHTYIYRVTVCLGPLADAQGGE